MKTLKIIIEKSSDHFSDYGQNCKGLYGAGNSPGEAKENILEALQLIKESESCPAILKTPYSIQFQYDVESFLKYYSAVFSKPALEKLTGIHQKQLHHYSAGTKKPRAAQRKKIEAAMHRLGEELLAVQF
jgi:predicted RNase H-like HicB family nuclease